MTFSLKSAAVRFAIGLALATAGGQAAQAAQQQHAMATMKAPPTGGMKAMNDMDAMMADPAMRQKMIARMGQCRDMMSSMMAHHAMDHQMMSRMGQCRDMMSMMMEHMKHHGDKAHQPSPAHKH